ncbi:EAL domain-containing protein [Chitiniphilus purpureus]|uniref:EAL domain-containing protein n=1 Tax=Chitiniphilus purpureus TaxID=2981137 RepID=A0ABY6DRY8_9NEIS|nr:EAL domain-containing protein [Chitiniphilus sp. CD1]UXY16998.1 EAL domain-containing protein [Chitiniphilus sp. CD1]
MLQNLFYRAREFYRENRLAWRMVAAVIVIGLLVTASLTVILVRIEYQRSLARVEADLDTLSSSVRPQLAVNLWLVNTEAVRTQLHSLLQTKVIGWARLVEPDGTRYEVGRLPASHVGVIRKRYMVEYEHPLTHRNVPLGELELVNSLEGLQSLLVVQLGRMLLLLGSGMMTAALCFLWLYHRLIARHLSHIADYTRRFNYERMTAPLVLSRGHSGQDELQTLTDAINTMRRNLLIGNAQRDEAQQAMLREKELAEVTLRSVADAILTTTADGRVKLLNTAAERLIGWTFAEARGRPITEIVVTLDDTGEADFASLLQLAQIGALPPGAVKTTITNRLGEHYRVEMAIVQIGDTDGGTGFVVALHDISAAEALTARLAYQAMHDELTGLTNRRGFMNALTLARDLVQEYGDARVVMQLDLDQFKLVNDTCGHQAGDELLRQLAQQLQEVLPKGVLVGRLGGDEFGFLLDTANEAEAQQVARNVLLALEQYRFVWTGRPFVVTGSMGLVRMDREICEPQEVMSCADVACYAAKEAGRNRFAWYRGAEENLEGRHNELQLLATLRQAAEQDWFRLHFQPIVPARPELGAGHHEVLLRLVEPHGRMVPPGAFIPAAERYDLMATIDRWVIAHVLDVLRRQPEQVSLSVNLSGKSLNRQTLAFVLERLDEAHVTPGRLCFEITETSAIANIHESTQFIEALRERGCRFALDDFGSGFSSFTYLKNLPVDYLKIDGSLIRDVVEDDVSRQMVIAVNRIAHAMGRQTIAEYVESEAIAAALRDIGVDYLQGYHIGMPQPELAAV